MAEAAGYEGVIDMRRVRHEILKDLPELIFPSVTAAIGFYVFIVSFGYQFETRAFASIASAVLICLSLALLVRQIFRNIVKVPSAAERSSGEERPRLLPLSIAVAWGVGFFIGMLLIGFQLTVPLWVFAFLVWCKASRVLAVLMPILLWGIMKFVLEYGLGPVFFRGILFGAKLPTFW